MRIPGLWREECPQIGVVWNVLKLGEVERATETSRLDVERG